MLRPIPDVCICILESATDRELKEKENLTTIINLFTLFRNIVNQLTASRYMKIKGLLYRDKLKVQIIR